MKKEIDMQEYVKISTDRQTSLLLKQVSEAIEFAITEGMGNSISIDTIDINKNLKTVIENQNKSPDLVEHLKEQLVKINTNVEKVSEYNLSQITSKNEVSRAIILKEIVSLFEKINNQDKALSDINLLQKEIEKNSKPIAEIKEHTITNYKSISENLQLITSTSDESNQTLNKVFEKLSNIKEQITLNNKDIKESIGIIISKQESIIESIKNIESIQNKPWYKKIIK